MAEIMTSQAASLQITPYVDKFFIERDKNIDGQLSFQEFLGAGQNLPTGTANSATNSSTAASHVATTTQTDDVQTILSDLQSTLMQLQELYGSTPSANPTSTATNDYTLQSTPSLNTTAAEPVPQTPTPAPTSSTASSAPTTTNASPSSSSHSNSLFNLIDANSDGVIAYQELQTFAVGQLTSGHASTDQLKTLFDSLDKQADLTDALPTQSTPVASSDSTTTSATVAAEDTDATPTDTSVANSSSAATGSHQAALFAEIDANEDGSLDTAELQTFTTAKFNEIRADLDQLARLFGVTA